MEQPTNLNTEPKTRRINKFSYLGLGLLIILGALVILAFRYQSLHQLFIKAQTSQTSLKTSLQKANNQISKLQTPTPPPPTNYTYPNTIADHNFSLLYPSGWRIQAKPNTQGSPIVEVQATSPTGTLLKVGANYGGIGGVCTPAPTDKPHAAGNLCPTKEYLSKTQISEKIWGDTKSPGQKLPLYLVTARYTGGDGKSTYFIGLEDDVKLNDPQMGLEYPFSYFQVSDVKGNLEYYVEIKAAGDSPAFLTSPDANQITTALKTFKFN